MKVIFFTLLMISSFVVCMQTPKELAFQLEEHPRATICFLYHYAHANFCDIDERGVYYTGIFLDEIDNTFILSWNQVKMVLGKAHEDLSRFDISQKDTGLKEEYRNVLKSVQQMYDIQHYKGTRLSYVYKNMQTYKNAWASGDLEQIKLALKLDLRGPHID